MKILICSVNFAPEVTATGKYTGELAQWLANRGHDVEVIAAPPHYPKWQIEPGYAGRGFYREDIGSVSVMRVPCYIPSPKRLSTVTRILMECTYTLLSTYWWVMLFAKKRKYDVVISICPPMQTALYPFLYKLLRRSPYVFHIQDFQLDMAMELGMIRQSKILRLLTHLEKFFLKRASLVSTISEAMMRKAIDKGADSRNLILCPNWSNIESVKPVEKDNSFRKKFGYGANDFIVMYAGAMGEKQGLDVILEAAALLEKKTDIKFVLVGNGGHRPQLESEASKRHIRNVNFIDLQPFEALCDMLGAANVHLVIQKRKAQDLVMPSKLTNILASGRPNIATALENSQIGITTKKYNFGLIAQPEDPISLSQAISEIYNDPDLAHQMGKNARAFAEEQLNIDVILGRFEKDLRALKS